MTGTEITHDAGTSLDQLYRYVTEPAGRFLAAFHWITPSRVSAASFLAGGVCTPILILTHPLWMAGIAFAASDFLDYLDGDVARAQGTTSREGDILDGILDRYTDFMTVSALIYLTTRQTGIEDLLLRDIRFLTPPVVFIVGLAALLGSLLPSYVKAVTIANGKRTVQSVGGRGTRNRVIFLGLLVSQATWILLILAVLGNIAAVHRTFRSIQSNDVHRGGTVER